MVPLTIDTAMTAAANLESPGGAALFAVIPFSMLLWRTRRRVLRGMVGTAALML